MKLRNKKTGKVFDVIVREKSNGDGEYSTIVCNLRSLRSARSVSSILGEYDSLAKLYEDWEDYTPAKPLIKDEKIRKAVRAWAEANDVKKVDYWNSDYRFEDMEGGSSINFEDNPIETEGRYGNDEYTITELCGEEEE